MNDFKRGEYNLVHKMRLNETPFKSMKSGRKVVEVRLNDEKRRALKKGDRIEFTRLPDKDETLMVEVLKLETFPNFRDLYDHIPPEDLDAVEDSLDEMVERTYDIYSKEQEKTWGTLAITIKIVE